MDAQEIIRRFGMQPHPTCGWFTTSFRSRWEIPPTGLGPPYVSARPYGTALYFLVAADSQTVLHRIRSDQLYHHYLGDPLEVLLLREGRAEVAVVGAELDTGQLPQLLVPALTFHVSRVRPGGSFALMGTTAWPGVEPADMEMGDREALAAAYPDHAEQIRTFGGGGGLAAPLDAFR